MAVIRSDHEYKKTRRQVASWQAARRNIVKIIESYGIENPELIVPMLDTHLNELQRKLEEYQKRASLDSNIDLRFVCNLGSRLIQARLTLGLAQKELAKMIGISPQLLNKLEKNHYQKAKLVDLEKVAAVLHTALEEKNSQQLNRHDK